MPGQGWFSWWGGVPRPYDPRGRLKSGNNWTADSFEEWAALIAATIKCKAEQLEQQGDAALDADSATAFYCQAQGLLMPAGVVWSDRAEYDERMLAYNRVQEKRYGVSNRAYPAPLAMSVEAPVGEPENVMPTAPAAWRILEIGRASCRERV